MKKSLTSTPDQFSDFAWELLLASENEARRWKHEYLDVEHMLQVLFTDKTFNKFVHGLPIKAEPLLDELESFLASLPTSNRNELFIGEDLEELLDESEKFRARWGSRLIEVSHILTALGRDKRIGAELFEEAGLPSQVLESELRRLPQPINRKRTQREEELPRQKSNNKILNSTPAQPSTSLKPSINQQQTSSEAKAEINKNIEQEFNPLQEFGRDLTLAALNGELDPVIGRDEEINLVIKVLSRRGKNNPVLIGAPGVGKTAIAELLAQRIIANNVPDLLKGLKLISLDIGALIAGTKFRGQFEERLRSVLSKASNPDSGVILFIDELHTILSTDRSSADPGSLLKPFLARGEIRCIGATTPESYRRAIEKDQALNRRFQQVPIKEPNIELSVEILRGVKNRYELHHEVKINDDALITANKLADRYINDRCLPDKAIDLIDEAAAQIKMEANSKPKILKEIESTLLQLENDICKAKENFQQEEINDIESKRNLAIEEYNHFSTQWEIETQKREALKKLTNQKVLIQTSIEEAEEKGDLETLARLQYDELHFIEEKEQNLENEIQELIQSGQSLLRDEVAPEDIADVVARWTGIPVNKVMAGERKKLLTLEKELGNKVIGQNEAVIAVSQAIKRARAGMKDSSRPIGSFLFLGPTGVGKTELAKTLAASLFDEEEALVRLDMSEFMERNAVARLLGAPPGYVGYEEGGQLTEAVSRKPYCVLLLDEIEKAHPDVFNILLQVLDDGRLTDSQGKTVDFRHTVVIMTSNLASKTILENKNFLSKPKEDINEELQENIDKALRNHFRPEFLNRIDETICFKPLSLVDLQKIVKLQLNELKSLLKDQSLELRIDDSTIELLAKEGYEPEYGARPLRRILRKQIENPLATKLLEDHFVGMSAVRIKTNEQNTELLEFLGEN